MRPPDWQTPDGSIQLHACACEELLAGIADCSVDLVITSPPYNTLPRDTRAYGFRATRAAGDQWLSKVSDRGYEDRMPEPDYQRWIRAILSACLRVSSGLACVNHKLRGNDGPSIHPLHFLGNFPLWREIIWDRCGSMSMNSGGHPTSHEAIYCFGRPAHWDQKRSGELTVWRVPPERGYKGHVCPWPVEIPLRLARAYCPPAGTVLDPFMGRGTAAAACLRTDRRFIGCEKDGRAFEEAVQFVEREYDRANPPLFRGVEMIERWDDGRSEAGAEQRQTTLKIVA